MKPSASVRQLVSRRTNQMKRPLSAFPFAHSQRSARWPTDIPPFMRRVWSRDKKAFTTLWSVPPGTGFEALRVRLVGRFAVLLVRRGAIHLWHGGHHVRAEDGQAVAVSTTEFHVEVPDCVTGDALFEVHVFRRMPNGNEVPARLSYLLSLHGYQAPGLFWFKDASILAAPELPGGGPVDSPRAVLCRLMAGSIAQTVAFFASGQPQSRAIINRVSSQYRSAWSTGEPLPDELFGIPMRPVRSVYDWVQYQPDSLTKLLQA